MAKFTLRLAAGFLLLVGLLLGSAPAFALTGASVSATLSSANIQPGVTTTLTVTITNPIGATPGVIVNSTTLPPGVNFAATPNLSSTCPAASSFNFGSNGLQKSTTVFEVTSVQLAAGTNCFYRVDVTAPSVGTYLITPDYAYTTTYDSSLNPITEFSGPAPTGVSLIVGTPPVISSINPSYGPTAGSTTVTITGSNFDPTPGNNTVMFGSVSANVTAATATSLTATSPAESFGSVNVTVTTPSPGGTSNAVAFTYYPPAQTCPTQIASLAISGTFPTTDLSVDCNDVLGGGLFLNAALAVANNNPIASSAAQTVTTTNATYSFFWNYSSAAGATGVDTYVVTLLSVGHNGPPDVTSSADLNGAAGTDSFTLYDDDNVPLAHPVPFAITIPAIPTPATHFTVTAPANATAGTAFTATVTALDASNTATTGYTGTVHFTSSEPQAVLPANASRTAGAGTFNVTYKTAGNQTLTATDTVTSSITGTSGATIVSAGAPNTMTANAGTTPQSPTIGTAFTNALAVTVKDAFSNAVSGVNITFTSPGSGASGGFANLTDTITVATNAAGVASASFTANSTVGGPYTVTAAAAGVTTVNFSMTNTPGAPSTMTANTLTTPQSSTINTAFATALGVTVKDASSNPVPGVNVTFTAPGSGASGIFSNATATITVATDASGIASAPFTANASAGGPYTVTAAATSLTTVNFSLTNTQGAQTLSFTSTAPNPATALGATYTPVAITSAPGSENLTVAITVDAASSTVCSINGAGVVSFLTSGTCKLDANQAGDVNYAPATQKQQVITVAAAAQTIVFTSTPPAVVAAGGATYIVAATGGASGNAVLFTVDASSIGICSIPPLGSTVSFLKSGTCIVDANQAGNGSYAPAVQVQQTILVQNGVGPTVAAIAGFLSDRNNAIVTNLWNMDGTIDRLNDAPGGAGPGAGLADQDQPVGQPPALLGGHALASQASQYGTAIPALGALSTSPASGAGMQDFLGLQQMIYGALRQLGETQSVSQLNYAGPFSAQMSTSGDMTGTFHTSLSQIMKWNDQAQQKQAASMGLNTSGAAGAHQFNPLDVWMQGTYAAINSTQQSKFGLLSSGVDYVFNRNLLLGFYGQVDFMNQTTGLQAAGTGWMVGPYGTMRLSDQVFLEARGGYGRSSNSMTDALDPALTDQFGSTRWLASAALAGRWQFGDHITFKPNFGFTYFTDSTDAYVNGLSVAIPSVTSQLGQFKFSPEVAKGFSLGDANWYEASIAPELIYNFTSTTADGLGSLDPTATGPQGLRGAIKWGVSMKTPTGLTIATQGSYDGIGANGYSAITASARLNVPLN